jgi:tetratricopeptide (TPR) repeat protein
MLRTLSLVMFLALVGCGEKQVNTNPTEVAGSVNAKSEYAGGVKALQAGDWAKALKSFERVVGIGVPDIEIKKEDGSVETKRAPGIKEDYAKAWFNAGYAAERLGDTAKAVEYYEKSYELAPTHEGTVFNLGLAYTADGKAKKAVDLYTKFIEANPGNLDARNNLADALTLAKMYPEAIAAAQEVLARDPKNVGAYRNLSGTYYAQGNYAMSLLCAEKARTFNEGDAGITNNMGVTHLAKGDEAAAIEQFKAAVEKDPTNVEANLNLGFLAVNSGDYGLALRSFEPVIKKQPSNLDAQIGYAIALRGNKKYDEAAAIYEALLKKDATNRMVVFNASTLHEKYRKDFDKADKILQTYKASSPSLATDPELGERIAAIEKSKEIERQRQEEIARKKKEQEERDARNAKLLGDLAAAVGQLEADIKDACVAAASPEIVEMAMMTLEQVKPVIEAKDTDSAPDMKTFVDDIKAQVDAIKSTCAGAAPAPDAGTPAPDAGGATPAPETPAAPTP